MHADIQDKRMYGFGLRYFGLTDELDNAITD